MGYYQKFFSLIGHSKIFIFFIFFLFSLSSLVEIFGIGLVGWFIGSLVDGGLNFHEKSYLKYLENIWPTSLSIMNIFYIIVFVIVLRFLFQLIVNFTIIYLSSNIERKIRNKVIACSLNESYEKFRNKSSSEIYNEVTTLTGQFGTAYYSLIKFLNDSILLVLISLLLLNVNYNLFLILVFFTALLFLSNKYLLWSKVKKLGKRFNAQSELSFKNIKNGLDSFKQLKVMNQTSFFINEVFKSFQKIMKLGVKYNFYSVIIKYSVELFLALILIITSIFISKLYSNQEIIALLAIFSLSAVRSLPLISNILNSSNSLFYLNDATNKLFEATKNFDKISNGNNRGAVHKKFSNLKIENLDFNYNKKVIFKNINLEIKRNEFILITGESGSGKTTLIDIILGLLKPTRGSIFLNNELVELNEYSLKNLVYYLPQKNFMIDDTIEKNIIFTEQKIDKKKIEDAINLSGLKKFYDDYKGKNYNKIGESGSLISGGEGQRIAFARSIYADKEILILDEFTNALDDNNEKLVLESLKKSSIKKTIILISHKSSLKSLVDKTYKIQNNNLILV